MADTQDLQRLVVSLEARIDKYTGAIEKVLNSTNSTLGNVEQRFKQAEGIIGRFGDGFADIGRKIIAAFAVERILEFTRESVKQVSELSEQSKKAGVNLRDLQGVLFAGARAGLSAETVVAALAKLNLNLGEAATKGNELGKILEANGIKLADLRGDPVAALKIIADLFERAGDEQKQAIIASAGFGKGFKELIPLLAEGSEGIQDQIDRAQALGLIYGDDLVSRVKRFDTALGEAFEVAKAGAVELADGLGVVIDKLAEISGLAPDIAKPARRGVEITDEAILERLRRAAHPEGSPVVIPTETKPDKAAAAANRQAEAISKVIENLIFEREQLTRTDREQAIYNELKKAGVDIDSIAGKKIAELAGKFYDEKQAIQDLTQSLDFARDATRGFFGDLIHGLKDGKTFTDALANAFSNLGDKLLDRTLDQLTDLLLGKQGTTGTGIVGQILGLGGSAATKALPGLSRNPYDVQRGTWPQGLYPIGPQKGGIRLGDANLAPIPFSGRPLGPIGQTVNQAGKSDFGYFGGGPLLDLISRAEGRTGYNTSLGYGAFLPGGKEMNLTSMTINGIKDLQAKMLANPANTLNSSALGRYQITRETLTDFQKRLGISGNELFDPAMQDRLALAIAQSTGGNVGALQGRWAGLQNIQPADISAAFKQQFAPAIQQISQTAQSSAQGFTTQLPSALSAILSALSAGFGGGGFASVGSFFEHVGGITGPLSVPSITPPAARTSGNGGGMALHVVPSKYFDVHVERISSAGDARTLDSARRSYPETAARFQKLGTTSR